MSPLERTFKANCRGYLYQKDRLDTLQRKHSYLFDESIRIPFIRSIETANAKTDFEFLSLEKECLETNISFVERTFDVIEATCGKKARMILWNYLIERKPMTEIAKSFSSQRTAERMVGTWMRMVFEGGLN